jgi:hypothetical protein
MYREKGEGRGEEEEEQTSWKVPNFTYFTSSGKANCIFTETV